MKSLEAGEERGAAPTGGFAVPRIVVSACLEFEPVRYDGQRISYDFVRELRPHVEFLPVCPEVEIGLGVPREPVRLVRSGRDRDGRARLVQPATDRDLTAEMLRFARSYLDGLAPVDGFLLKNRSPSCGTVDVKIYGEGDDAGPVARGSGLFASEVLARMPELAVENEGRLRNFVLREHFLTKLFALADLRRVRDEGGMGALVAFHTRYKLVLMAYDQEAMRSLGRVVANEEGRPFPEVMETYRKGFAEALEQPPTYRPVVNVLQHAAGHFKDRLGREEKRFFWDVLDRYREGKVPVSAVTTVVRSWAVRFSSGWLLDQAFFRPYPEELISLSDSGKGGAPR